LATVENGGDRKVKQIEITLEFHDPFNQVVLRDTQRPFSSDRRAHAARTTKGFQVGYEQLPRAME